MTICRAQLQHFLQYISAVANAELRWLPWKLDKTQNTGGHGSKLLHATVVRRFVLFRLTLRDFVSAAYVYEML